MEGQKWRRKEGHLGGYRGRREKGVENQDFGEMKKNKKEEVIVKQRRERNDPEVETEDHGTCL